MTAMHDVVWGGSEKLSQTAIYEECHNNGDALNGVKGQGDSTSCGSVRKEW